MKWPNLKVTADFKSVVFNGSAQSATKPLAINKPHVIWALSTAMRQGRYEELSKYSPACYYPPNGEWSSLFLPATIQTTANLQKPHLLWGAVVSVGLGLRRQGFKSSLGREAHWVTSDQSLPQSSLPHRVVGDKWRGGEPCTQIWASWIKYEV